MRTPNNDAGRLTSRSEAGNAVAPFALSLSKCCPPFAEGTQCLHKLNTNGNGFTRRFGGAA